MNARPPNRTGLAGRVASFRWAIRGIGVLLSTQANARLHALAAVLVVALGTWLQLSLLEWCVIISAIALVLVAEALNTALEFLTDIQTLEQHPLAEKAKDVAAGAVLIASVAAAVIGVTVFGPKLLEQAQRWSAPPSALAIQAAPALS